MYTNFPNILIKFFNKFILYKFVQNINIFYKYNSIISLNLSDIGFNKNTFTFNNTGHTTTSSNTTVYTNINQKKNNLKTSVVYNTKCVNTFSIGSVVKLFKLQQGKCIRRSSKGSKILLNFVSKILETKFNKIVGNKSGVKIYCLNIVGYDYNLYTLKRFIKSLFLKNVLKTYLLFNICVSFTKLKSKKVKAIKKRLKKKILLNFLKNFKKN